MLDTTPHNFVRGHTWDLSPELMALAMKVKEKPWEEVFFEWRKLQFANEAIWVILCPPWFEDGFNSVETLRTADEKWLIRLRSRNKWVVGLKEDNTWITSPYDSKHLNAIWEPNINWERICDIEHFPRPQNALYNEEDWFVSIEVNGRRLEVFKRIEEIVWGYKFTTPQWLEATIKRNISYVVEI